MSGELIEIPARKVLLLPPADAAKHDPPLAEFLALPMCDEVCPHCQHPYWGTRNPVGYLLVRYCKECRGTWRGYPTAETIHRLTGALLGRPERLAR